MPVLLPFHETVGFSLYSAFHILLLYLLISLHFGGLGPGKKGCLGPGDVVSGDFMTISTTMSGAPKAAQLSNRV